MPAKRVLIGWELGGGLGHLTRLQPIVGALCASGIEVTLAAVDRRAAELCYRKAADRRDLLTIVQAPGRPIAKARIVNDFPTITLADVLAKDAYDDTNSLFGLTNGWFELLRRLRPDLVVSDFSPGLNLVARLFAPLIVVGSGYTVPPAAPRLPALRPWRPEIPDDSRRREDRILNAAGTILHKNGASGLASLAEAFHGDRSFVFTLPEFDPYRPARVTPTLSPFNFSLAQPAMASNARESLAFVYLPSQHPHVRPVIDALQGAGLRTQAYLPGIDSRTAEEIRARGVSLHEQPADLAAVVPTARLIVHQGGLATTLCGLVAATPQLVLPTFLEQLVTAVGLRSFQCCSVISSGEGDCDEIIGAAAKRLTEDPVISANATKAARDVGGRVDLRSFETVVECCLEYLR